MSVTTHEAIPEPAKGILQNQLRKSWASKKISTLKQFLAHAELLETIKDKKDSLDNHKVLRNSQECS